MEEKKTEHISTPQLKLDEIELLKMENIQLKIINVENSLKDLYHLRDNIKKDIESRLCIPDITKYNIDLKTGFLTRGNKNGI